MLSASALEIFTILQRNPAGLSRSMIVQLSGIDQKEVISALQEIEDVHDDLKRWRDGDNNMYKLVNEKFELERDVLIALVRHKTRIHPRTIAQQLHVLQCSVNDTLNALVQSKIVSVRLPGTYHVTVSGIAYIRTKYPTLALPDGFEKRCALEDQATSQAFSLGAFTLQVPSTYKPREKLSNPADTINLIQGLGVDLPKRNQAQIRELVEFLMHHALPAQQAGDHA